MAGKKAKIVDGKLVVDEQIEKGDDSINTASAEAEAPVVSQKKQRKVRVMINQQDGPDGKFDVTLGVNGKVLLIKRGEEVEIPEEYFFVLRDAKIDQLVRNPGEEEQVITMSRYSYNVLPEAR